ncbi:Pkinase-domain-containing protein [Coprinopsis marcescibilis]|uniref:mitogen-activated protein kinase kinase kinase n=1 Tax=Coprinopsis marcescibilis TaxID=230819 RepID=A0A5C3LB17_COPMA|nr:Pkinase-domain-containing protein [Coprinopsis marcescibilis]
MSVLATSASFLSPDTLLSQSPPKPLSPAVSSPSYPSLNNSRSFMNMGSLELRGQQFPPNNISLDPPLGTSFADFVKTWSDSHVSRWLSDMKCAVHSEVFKSNDIRGNVLLDLDQEELKEMNITSIGDRLRILNAVKILRQRAAGRVASRTTESHHTRTLSDTGKNDINGRHHARKEPSRPPPLTLHPNSNKENLPDIIRDGAPDSATGRAPPALSVRPLPLPNPAVGNVQNGTPGASQLSTPGGSMRSNLPPLPPPPRGQPPPPPPMPRSTRPFPPSGDAPAYTSQPLPPPPQNQSLLTPSSNANWSGQSGSSNGRPVRSTSPLPPPRVRGPVSKPSGVTSPNNSPARRPGHPYASVQSTLHPPTSLQAHNLSPIEETFGTGTSSQNNSLASTPSPPSQTYNGKPSLNDLRKKIVKFVFPEGETSYTINVTNCSSGQEIIEKVLKKAGKGTYNGDNRNDGILCVDGWSVYLDAYDDNADPLSEAQLLSICNAPDHPARERGLAVRRLRRFDDRGLGLPGQTSKATKRASSISILSGLGVRNPEKALSDPPSPGGGTPSPPPPPPPIVIQDSPKRPSKLRNFFGQRPPSELITDHLPEFFPMAEKKVLRTARHSILLRSGTVKRHSNIQGRHSISPSRASLSSIPPPLPEKHEHGDHIPRMSLSTEDGHSVDLHSDDEDGAKAAPQLLPPIPTGSFTDSIEEITGSRPSRPVSRATSIASKRMSYMSELRSKRDRSDTASMMTVDEIVAEVESRRVSQVPDEPVPNQDLDDWTKVDTEETLASVPSEEEVEVEVAEEDEVGTLATEDGDDEDDDDDDDDDDFGIAIPTRTANKWIKGALIGAGSFGKVYLGMDASNGLLMAVKQVELPQGTGPNQERKKSMLSALEREIELLKVLQHENIVQYLYSSLDEEYLNIFLEYVPGGSVATLLQNYGAFEEGLVRNFVRQILQGLDYLHGRDIIHRDIKGANILVDNKGGVKISDFGISKKVDDNLLGGNRLHRPSLQGSVFWMAPEVVKQTGHTKKADIWSVGCLVVEMLTGEHPWAQLTQMQAIFKIGSSAKPTIPADISQEAQEFLLKTFEINHELRPHAPELLQHPWIAKKSKKAQAAAAAAAQAAANAAANEAS